MCCGNCACTYCMWGTVKQRLSRSIRDVKRNIDCGSFDYVRNFDKRDYCNANVRRSCQHARTR